MHVCDKGGTDGFHIEDDWLTLNSSPSVARVFEYAILGSCNVRVDRIHESDGARLPASKMWQETSHKVCHAEEIDVELPVPDFGAELLLTP